jgi:hypothetical protein
MVGCLQAEQAHSRSILTLVSPPRLKSVVGVFVELDCVAYAEIAALQVVLGGAIRINNSEIIDTCTASPVKIDHGTHSMCQSSVAQDVGSPSGTGMSGYVYSVDCVSSVVEKPEVPLIRGSGACRSKNQQAGD